MNYQIIDVNLNRLREGLKICEDISRFHYEDQKLLLSLRKIRFRILPLIKKIEVKVLPFRKSEKDLGRGKEFDWAKRENIANLFLTNIKRAEEACRALEEFSKIRKSYGIKPLNSEKWLNFKEVRFTLYDLEKEFIKKYGKDLILHLYAILDLESLSTFFKKIPPLSELGFILATGSDVIQFRGKKDALTIELFRQAEEIKKGIEKVKKKVLFLINDRIDICLACGADGVHLGKKDIPLKRAREILPEKIVGATIRNLKDLKLAAESGCDYVGCGSVFPSPTKPIAPVIGLKRLKMVVKRSSLPVVAIGGINQKNLPEVLKTGVAGVALVSALFSEGKIRENLKKIRKIIKRYSA
ncbi:MAG: thiamine phosphate synthase [candidate division WOR-3 bacterium]